VGTCPGGPVAQGTAFGGVSAVRLLPALVLGPLAGLLADRFGRRHTMIGCDLLRFALFASIPAAGLVVADRGAVVGWAAVATFLIEALAMVWSPARDAAIPTLVPREQLEAANRLSLATTYGVTPVVAALAMAGAVRPRGGGPRRRPGRVAADRRPPGRPGAAGPVPGRAASR